ncbi:hypothetical protein [Mycolicibacterium frederiksbergense]|uniref:Uncharacterized protein n=1 Tax=Mycolicibacterium frederiksbergense TaxID=117567 RepID=A0A6H0RZM9_9MYCO|nr:hypothetical protein [Mycolicibacterium frederiksbergense]QIV80386.1 hypothetical protein EXE63_05355 [Mycolicibacterium frederiksbergense]
MTTDVQRESLIGALVRARIPAENHAFIQAMVAAAGLTQFSIVDVSEPYVSATGNGNFPALSIFWGYTTGFTTEEEASSVSGVAGERPLSGKGPWFVAHPTNRVRREAQQRSHRPKAGLCSTCSMELPLTGVCDDCG